MRAFARLFSIPENVSPDRETVLVARKLVQTSVSLFGRFRLVPLSERVLLLLFVLTLPLANPWVRGDGVGYYAFARALLIQHNLDFAPDYQHANTSFREGRLDESGQP